MRAASFCTAKNYFLPSIQLLYKQQGFETALKGKVLEVYREDLTRVIFFFSHGVFVSWGFANNEEKQIIQQIKSCSVAPLKQVEKRYFLCKLGSTTKVTPPRRFNIEMIILESEDLDIKLAVSYGLAQSMKLESYEEAIQQTIKKNLCVIDELAEKGSISLSSKAISKRKGEIFLARSSVNLNSDFLDLPEYFWEHPNLESYYESTEQYLDIKRRVHALNQQLDVLHELFDMLTGQLQHKHSAVLEMIIIFLIFIEITLTTIQMIFFR
jgi:uncharacterized Rmd1/YagE family protein